MLEAVRLVEGRKLLEVAFDARGEVLGVEIRSLAPHELEL
jgi:hypothetical protein